MILLNSESLEHVSLGSLLQLSLELANTKHFDPRHLLDRYVHPEAQEWMRLHHSELMALNLGGFKDEAAELRRLQLESQDRVHNAKSRQVIFSDFDCASDEESLPHVIVLEVLNGVRVAEHVQR